MLTSTAPTFQARPIRRQRVGAFDAEQFDDKVGQFGIRQFEVKVNSPTTFAQVSECRGSSCDLLSVFVDRKFNRAMALAVKTTSQTHFLSCREQYAFQLQPTDIQRMVANAPLEASGMRAANSPAVLTLPHPDGRPRRFRILESPIIEPGMAAKFPDIKSYTAQGVDDPTATARFSWTSRGLHASFQATITAFTFTRWIIAPPPTTLVIMANKTTSLNVE